MLLIILNVVFYGSLAAFVALIVPILSENRHDRGPVSKQEGWVSVCTLIFLLATVGLEYFC